MFENSIRGPLILHCAVMAVAHVIIALVLRSRGKLQWMSGGFWAWFMSVMIFVVHPFVSLFSDMTMYTVRLQNTSGAPHVYWILLVLLAGLATFFAAYCVAGDGRTYRVADVRPSRPVMVVLIAFTALGFYSMLAYRIGAPGAGAGAADYAVGIDGRFTGDVTGWACSLQRFVLFPMAFFWAFRSTRAFGIVLLLAYTTIRLFDPSERITVFVPALALGFVLMAERGLRWPPLWSAAVAGLLLAFLVLRAHVSVQEFDLAEATRDLDGRAAEIIAGADTDMLPQFYKVSAVFDDQGYSYGMPFVEAALFGYLPRKYFPWKNALSQRIGFNPWNNVRWCRYLAGPKSPLIGETYYWGGLLAVLLVCPVLGYLLRKLDGMTAARQPTVVRALGFTYLSFVFMFFLSSPEWVLQYVAVIAIPFVGALLTVRFIGTQRTDTTLRGPAYAAARTAAGTVAAGTVAAVPTSPHDRAIPLAGAPAVSVPSKSRSLALRGLRLFTLRAADPFRKARVVNRDVAAPVRPGIRRPMVGWRTPAGP